MGHYAAELGSVYHPTDQEIKDKKKKEEEKILNAMREIEAILEPIDVHLRPSELAPRIEALYDSSIWMIAFWRLVGKGRISWMRTSYVELNRGENKLPLE